MVDLVFDGGCGFCTRCVDWIVRLDRRGRVRLHPAQRPGVRERFALSEADVRDAAWAFRGGRRTRGAAAVSLALDAALGISALSALHRLPGVRRIEESAYRWVAAHRSRLPGTRPWCSRYPQDCGAGNGGKGRQTSSSGDGGRCPAL